MIQQQLKERTKRFALDIINLTEGVSTNRAADVLARQLLRSGTSVGSNYRAACRARSSAEFIAKLGIVEEEADETLFWMELLIAKKMVADEKAQPLIKEADELLSITVASIKTARKNRGK